MTNKNLFPLKPLKVLPVLVCRREQTGAAALGTRIDELKKNLTVESQVLTEVVVNEEKDIDSLKRHGMDADVILLYKPRLGLGNCVIKIVELGLPVILFDEENRVTWPLDAMEYIYPQKNVWVAVDYSDINLRLRLLDAMKRIKETKVLVLNSDYPHWGSWLGRIPRGSETIKERLGIELEYVESTDVFERWKSVEEQKAKTVAEKWRKGAERVIEPKEDDLVAVARLYLVIKELLEERDAQAITLAYGDKPLPVPCFAYTNLRDEGIPAACEADIISLLLMIILHNLTDRPSFMGNLSVNPDDNTIMLSHCVAPLKMRGYNMPPAPYVLRDQHHGVPLGSVSAYVELDTGREVTVCRLSNDLRDMLVTKGHIVSCDDLEGYCRITLRIKLDAPIREFINKTSGNHHIVGYGDYREQLRELNKLLDIATVEV